jgi:hypothetical protein
MGAVFFFDLSETLGSVAVDTSGSVARLDAYFFVPAISKRLGAKGLTLGAILNTDSRLAADSNKCLRQSKPFNTHLLTFSSTVRSLTFGKVQQRPSETLWLRAVDSGWLK